VNGVATFDKSQLKQVVTDEKIRLPDKEEIENERSNKTEASV
jgi:hypothetical protein